MDPEERRKNASSEREMVSLLSENTVSQRVQVENYCVKQFTFPWILGTITRCPGGVWNPALGVGAGAFQRIGGRIFFDRGRRRKLWIQ